MSKTGIIKHFNLASLEMRTLEKQIAEVFDPSPVSLSCMLCRQSFISEAECELACPDCVTESQISCIEGVLEDEGIDLDTVGDFGEYDGEDISPLGEFYYGPITYDGPKLRCTPEQNRLLLELKALLNGKL